MLRPSKFPLWVRLLLWVLGAKPRELVYFAGMAHELLVSHLDRDDWQASCSCGWNGSRVPEGDAGLEAHKHRTQAFFADVANEMRRPSFGEMQAGFMRAMLVRAQEAKLYTPENP